MSFFPIVSFCFCLNVFFLKGPLCQAAVCNGCCTNYMVINDPRRSIKSVWQPGQEPLCDRRIQRGWYRFNDQTTGPQMPESVVQEYHCGTHDPIWLKGRHPSLQEGNVALEACINSFGVCFRPFFVNVQKCSGNYFVYYLKPLFYCATAYCAGKRKCNFRFISFVMVVHSLNVKLHFFKVTSSHAPTEKLVYTLTVLVSSYFDSTFHFITCVTQKRVLGIREVKLYEIGTTIDRGLALALLQNVAK